MKQDLLGAVLLLDYESCCTEKWLVSYYDTNHFFCRCGIEKRHPAHDERTHVRTCLRGDSVGICNRNRGNRQYRFSICSCLLHSISIYVTMLMLNCWTVLNFDRSYHESTNHIERQ